jgi:hypothetical protein
MDWASPEAAEPAEAKPEKPAEAAEVVPRPVPSVRGGYGHTPVTYQILEEAMTKLLKDERARRNKAIDATAKLIVDEVIKTFASARTKTNWRFEEAERRVAELEARLADLEDRANG